MRNSLFGVVLGGEVRKAVGVVVVVVVVVVVLEGVFVGVVNS